MRSLIVTSHLSRFLQPPARLPPLLVAARLTVVPLAAVVAVEAGLPAPRLTLGLLMLRPRLLVVSHHPNLCLSAITSVHSSPYHHDSAISTNSALN